MCIFYTSSPLVTIPIDKVKWITFHNCGNPKWHSFKSSFSWIENILDLDIVITNKCPSKQTTEPKLLILVSFFSGEDTSFNDTCYCNQILWVICWTVLIGPPCTCILSLRLTSQHLWCHHLYPGVRLPGHRDPSSGQSTPECPGQGPTRTP